jgi:predicted glycoside hydrolase/deacetylase ChbG (UPF0249 family)
MPNGAAFDDAVRIARENPGLGVGIHISLVDERPIAPVSKLKGLVSPDGRLPKSYGSFIRKMVLLRFGSTEVRCEVEAQVARVLEAGIAPTHIDSHQHLHIFPGVFGAVLEVAREAGIGVVRLPMGRCMAIPVGVRDIQQRVLWNLCVTRIAELRRTGTHYVEHFHGFRESGKMNEKNLLRVLGQLRPGVNEIMMHPGFSDPETSKRYQWGYHWDDERDAIVSPRVREIVEEQEIRLASFADALQREPA